MRGGGWCSGPHRGTERGGHGGCPYRWDQGAFPCPSSDRFSPARLPVVDKHPQDKAHSPIPVPRALPPLPLGPSPNAAWLPKPCPLRCFDRPPSLAAPGQHTHPWGPGRNTASCNKPPATVCHSPWPSTEPPTLVPCNQQALGGQGLAPVPRKCWGPACWWHSGAPSHLTQQTCWPCLPDGRFPALCSRRWGSSSSHMRGRDLDPLSDPTPPQHVSKPWQGACMASQPGQMAPFLDQDERTPTPSWACPGLLPSLSFCPLRTSFLPSDSPCAGKVPGSRQDSQVQPPGP